MTLTLSLLAGALIVGVFAGWRGARPSDFLRPRMVPWRFIMLLAGALATQNIALKAAADALRAELDFIQGTRSWKVTAPLRKMKGRGAS